MQQFARAAIRGNTPVLLVYRPHTVYQQEAQLSQRNQAMLYISKFMVCFTRYGSKKGFSQQK